MGWLTQAAEEAEGLANEFYNTRDRAVLAANKALGGAEKYGRDALRSWSWDDRPAMSGEAKVIHPFQFYQFTTAPYGIGITRLPERLLAAGQKVNQWRNEAIRQAAKFKAPTTNLKTPKMPSIRSSLRGKGLKRKAAVAGAVGTATGKYLLSKTPTAAKIGKKLIKNPGIPAALIGSVLTKPTQHGSPNRGEQTDSENWIRMRKNSRGRWL